MKKLRLNFLIWFLIFWAVASTATAQYRFDVWTTENGLPQNSVTAILQTKDGYIWFATFGGLVRFDGIKFKIFNTINAPAIKSNRITALFEDKNGTLWIGTQYGNLVSYKDEVFTSVLEPPTTPRAAIFITCVDQSGAIWMPVGLDLYKYTPDASGKFAAEKVPLPKKETSTIGAIVQDDAGNVWISTSDALYQYQNGTIQTFSYPVTFPPIKPVGGGNGSPSVKIFIDGKKRFWLIENDVLMRFENGGFVSFFEKQNSSLGFVENVDGSFFLKAEDKVYRFADDKLQETLIDKSDKFVVFRTIMADREGNLWIGTTGKGLFRYKQQTARTYAKADGLTDNDTYFVFEDRDKNLWIGADNLYKFRDGKFEIALKYSNGNFVSAFQSKDGTLWFGTNGGLFTYKNGSFSDFPKESGINTQKAFEDSRGTMFFQTPEGLVISRNGNREIISPQNSFINTNIQSTIEDRNGAVWFGTVNGVSRYQDGVCASFSSKDGLSNDNVRDIYEDRDGVLWFGTYGGGLNRFKDGKFFPITTREGMNEDIVSRIIVDEKDNFWMLGNRGISVISRSALNDLADGKIKTIACASYGVSDGMLNSEGNGGNIPAGWQSSDGKFWFPSIQGVIVIDPKFSDLPPPPVYIEEVFLGGKEIESSSEIEVAADKENLEIHYTGLNFTKPEQVKFKYKLEGFDQDWIEVGTRRAAYYTQIPAGNYRFLVTASTTNGVWNEQPAVKNVVVLSNPIWKKPWFILLVSLILIIILILFYRIRLFRLEKTRERQQEFSRKLIESQEQERKRIAAGLHDSLGQHLIIIKNWATLALGVLDKKSPAREQISEISDTSLQALNEVREIINDLRPHQIETIGLTDTIKAMIEQVEAASRINFEFEYDRVDQLLSKDDEVTFYRIIQEYINNIVKHSGAENAFVSIKNGSNAIRVKISDDGKGFGAEDKNKVKSGFGLVGVRERLKMLGGNQIIQTAVGEGTKIDIEIELK